MGWKHVEAGFDLPIGHAELLIYLAIARRAHNQNDECFPSVSEISEVTHYNRKYIESVITGLCKMGYLKKIRKRRRGQPTRYLVLGNKVTLSDLKDANEVTLYDLKKEMRSDNLPNEVRLSSTAYKDAREILREPVINREDIREEKDNTCASPAFDPSSQIPREAAPDEDTTQLMTGTELYHYHRAILSEVVAGIEQLSPIRYAIDTTFEAMVKACVTTYGKEATIAYPEWVGTPISGWPFWDNGQHKEEWEANTTPWNLFQTHLLKKRLPRVVHWLALGRPDSHRPSRAEEYETRLDALADRYENPSMDAEFYDVGDDHDPSPDQTVWPHVSTLRQILPAGHEHDARNGHRTD